MSSILRPVPEGFQPHDSPVCAVQSDSVPVLPSNDMRLIDLSPSTLSTVTERSPTIHCPDTCSGPISTVEPVMSGRVGKVLHWLGIVNEIARCPVLEQQAQTRHLHLVETLDTSAQENS